MRRVLSDRANLERRTNFAWTLGGQEALNFSGSRFRGMILVWQLRAEVSEPEGRGTSAEKDAGQDQPDNYQSQPFARRLPGG